MNSQRIYNYHRFPNASPISIPIPIAFKIIRISDIIFGRKSTLNHSTLKKKKKGKKTKLHGKKKEKTIPSLVHSNWRMDREIAFPSTASNSIVPPFLSRIRASPSDIHPVVVCHHAIYYLPIIPAPRRLRP